MYKNRRLSTIIYTTFIKEVPILPSRNGNIPVDKKKWQEKHEKQPERLFGKLLLEELFERRRNQLERRFERLSEKQENRLERQLERLLEKPENQLVKQLERLFEELREL